MSVVRRGVVMMVVAGLALGASGCAKVPQPAIDQARETLAAAGQAQASIYAAAEWDAAQGAVNAAMAEIEAQNAKFALLRSYGKAEELLAAAQQQAAAAQQAAVAGKEQMRVEVAESVAAIEGKLAQGQQILGELAACRKRPKGFAADLELMTGKVDALASQLVNLRSTAAAEDFVEAKSMAQGLATEVDVVLVDLENAKAALGC